MAGFSVALMQSLGKEVEREIEFRLVDRFDEMLDLVARRDVDAAIATITITEAREEKLDFSQPMFDARRKVMVFDGGSSIGLLGALFNLEMLGLVALSFLLLFAAAKLMWYFEHRVQPYFQ